MAIRHVPNECEKKLLQDAELKASLVSRSLFGSIPFELKVEDGASFEIVIDFARPFKHIPHVSYSLKMPLKDRFSVQTELGDVSERLFIVALLNTSSHDVVGEIYWKAEVPLLP